MSTQSIFFITGTDTDAGKTFVSCALLEAAAKRGCSTAAVKPVAAGARLQGGQWKNEDALALQSAMTMKADYALINPVCFEPAIAPHIAATQVGVPLLASGLAEACTAIRDLHADLTLVEGAGGWRVPLNEQEDIADLVKILDIPVILVVAMKLGCINHALLTVNAILSDGVTLAGWIANSPASQKMACYEENLQTLRHRIDAPLLGEIPFSAEQQATGIYKPCDRILDCLIS